jgi:hypothetical protein
VGILTAGKQSVEMLGEDGKISVQVVDAGVVVTRHRDRNVTWTFVRMAANARQ